MKDTHAEYERLWIALNGRSILMLEPYEWQGFTESQQREILSKMEAELNRKRVFEKARALARYQLDSYKNARVQRLLPKPRLSYLLGDWHCMIDYAKETDPIGLGDTPKEAYDDWERKMRNG